MQTPAWSAAEARRKITSSDALHLYAVVALDVAAALGAVELHVAVLLDAAAVAEPPDAAVAVVERHDVAVAAVVEGLPDAAVEQPDAVAVPRVAEQPGALAAALSLDCVSELPQGGARCDLPQAAC